jgi:hypothetical protein
MGGNLLIFILIALIGPAAAEQGPAFDLSVDAPAQLAVVRSRVEAVRPESLAASLGHAGLSLPERVHVTIIPSDDRRARAMPEWVAGLASGSDQIVIFPDRIGAYPYDSLESLVLHEIVHLALNVRAGGRPLPRWFHEGVAVSVESGWGIGSQARLLLAAARDPGMDDVDRLFASDRAPETSTAYLLSAALVEDIRRRHGLAVPGAIAARVAQGDPFDRAFFLVTNETVDEAAANAWRVYRGLRWLPVLTGTSAVWGAILTLAVVAFFVRVRRRRAKRWEEEETKEEDDDELPLPADDDRQES